MPNDPLDIANTLKPPDKHDSVYTLSPGDALGQYKIIRSLGRGGMGEVYEVEHQVLRKRFALKMLGAELTVRPDAVERFKREAQVMAGLDHPNVLAVDEFGLAPPESPAAGRYWLRMKLAGDGGDLRSLEDLARGSGGKLDADTWHAVMTHVLKGLAYAHESGVVHRDLKPSNILLSIGADGGDCIPTISDFGLARLVGEDWLRSQVEQSVRLSISIGDMRTMEGSGSGAEGTSTRALLGTYEYMSPEQKAGEEATSASDIYAIGLMGYRLLTGRSPTLKKPSELVPGLNPGWDRWIGDCLEENPQDRPTARQLLDRMPAKMMAPSQLATAAALPQITRMQTAVPPPSTPAAPPASHLEITSTPPRRTGAATASLVLGLIGLLPYLGLLGIPAVICGHIARARIKRKPETTTGNGCALAGITLGYVEISFSIILIAVLTIMNLMKS